MRHLFYIDLDTFVRPGDHPSATTALDAAAGGRAEVRLTKIHTTNALRPYWLAGGMKY